MTTAPAPGSVFPTDATHNVFSGHPWVLIDIEPWMATEAHSYDDIADRVEDITVLYIAKPECAWDDETETALPDFAENTVVGLIRLPSSNSELYPRPANGYDRDRILKDVREMAAIRIRAVNARTQ